MKEKILRALSTVDDPDLKKDLVTLNMIRNVVADSKKVSFDLVLTTPACPLKEVIKNNCIQAIKTQVDENIEIDVNVTADVTSTRSKEELLTGVKNIIAVASGKGGVGKSTVTSNLAVALAKSGAKVGLLDADIFGPSIPTMFDCEGAQPDIKKVGEKNLIVPIEKYGIKILSIGFLTDPKNAVVWRGPMAGSALKQFITDTLWEDLDYLLIDLPPGTSDIHLTLVQTIPVTGAVIVTTPQKVATADAERGIDMFQQEKINVPILGLIENMAYFSPEELPQNKYYIFGKDGGQKLADKRGISFLGQIPIVESIRESCDEGHPEILKDSISAKAFEQLAKSVAQQVAIRNASADKTKIVEITEK